MKLSEKAFDLLSTPTTPEVRLTFLSAKLTASIMHAVSGLSDEDLDHLPGSGLVVYCARDLAVGGFGLHSVRVLTRFEPGEVQQSFPREADWRALPVVLSRLREWVMIEQHAMGQPLAQVNWETMDRRARLATVLTRIQMFQPFTEALQHHARNAQAANATAHLHRPRKSRPPIQ